MTGGVRGPLEPPPPRAAGGAGGDQAEAALVEAAVRRATPADAPGIAAVQVTTWREAYRGIMPAAGLEKLSVERSREGWESMLSEEGSTVAVAIIGERVVGFSAYGPSRDPEAPPATGEVYALYLLPELWSTGLGTRLWAASVEGLAAAGLDEVIVWVLRENRRARGFYERRGMTLDPDAILDFQIEGAALPEVRYRSALDLQRRPLPNRDR
jgi:ribosomal protein S18 acetylase RimI-like enzyme